MDICYVWEGGYTVNLSVEPENPTPTYMVDRVVQLLTTLMPIVQPIAILTMVNCTSNEPPYLKTTELPQSQAWYIHEDLPPARVRIPAFASLDQDEHVPTLSPSIIAEWLQRTIAQNAPSETDVVSLERLEIRAARTRLYTARSNESTESWTLAWSPGNTAPVPVQVETRSDGLWVSAPVYDLPVDPAITLTMTQQYGVLEARLSVHWSLWFEPGHAEFEALQHVLQRLVALGWEHQPLATMHNNDVYGLTGVVAS